MKSYIVCVYKSINNENVLKEYVAKTKPAVEKYKGKFLIRGGKKITTEGNESPRTAVIEFPSFSKAEIFFYTKECREAHAILRGTAVRHHQIIEGS